MTVVTFVATDISSEIPPNCPAKVKVDEIEHVTKSGTMPREKHLYSCTRESFFNNNPLCKPCRLNPYYQERR